MIKISHINLFLWVMDNLFLGWVGVIVECSNIIIMLRYPVGMAILS